MSSQLRMQGTGSAVLQVELAADHATASVEIDKPAWGDLLRAVRSGPCLHARVACTLPSAFNCAPEFEPL